MNFGRSRRLFIFILSLLAILLWGCYGPNSAADDVRLLFKDYGWTIGEQLAGVDTMISMELREGQSTSAAAIYWYMVNVYSKAIGLDMSEYAGKNVHLEAFALANDSQEPVAGQGEFPSGFNGKGRALVVRWEERIIGAWLDRAGRPIYSLAGKSMEGITGSSAEDWLDELRSSDAAPAKEPEDVIGAYFSSHAVGDFVSAFKELSSSFMLGCLFNNLDDHELYNAYPHPFPTDAVAELISMAEQAYPEPDAVAANKRLFYVKFNLEWPAGAPSAYTQGVNERFFIMTQTKLGWKIDALGTGF